MKSGHLYRLKSPRMGLKNQISGARLTVKSKTPPWLPAAARRGGKSSSCLAEESIRASFSSWSPSLTASFLLQALVFQASPCTLSGLAEPAGTDSDEEDGRAPPCSALSQKILGYGLISERQEQLR